MALPLPQIPAGGFGMNALLQGNALAQDTFQNRIKQSEAEYAPYNNYANAASKIAYANYLPSQLQAQTLSNPLLWMSLKDNPQIAQKMLSNFMNSIPQQSQILGALPPPSMAPRGDGLMGFLQNALMQPSGQSNQNQPNQNAIAGMPYSDQSVNSLSPPSANSSNPPASYSPLVPATGGGTSAISGKMLAEYQQSPYNEGKTFVDPATNKIFSVPTNATVTQVQQAINATKRVSPQLERLADEASPFLSAKGMAENQIGRVKNLLQLGKPSELPTQYAKFQSTLKAAPESLLKAYGLKPTNETIERMQEVIEPYAGETKDQYKSRILEQLEHLRAEQMGIGEQQLRSGISLDNDQDQSPAPAISNTKSMPATIASQEETIKKDADQFKAQLIQLRGVDPVDKKIKIWNVPQGKAQLYIDNGFTRV